MTVLPKGIGQRRPGKGYPRALADDDRVDVDGAEGEDDGVAALLQDALEIAEKRLSGPEGKAARDWLHDRGVVEPEIKRHQLGFFPNFHTIDHELRARGHSPEEIRKVFPAKGPKFDGRIIGSFSDDNGNLRSLWGRIIKPGMTSRKYVFVKGREKPLFYGLDVARQHGSVDQLILVEGMFDVLQLNAAGLYNVVALAGPGSLLTLARWEALARLGVRGVVLAFDSDEAGISGLESALVNHSKVPGAPTVSLVPPNRLETAKDPDEYVRAHGADAFMKLVDEAIPGAIYRGERIFNGIDPTSDQKERRAALEHLFDLIGSVTGRTAALDRDALVRLAADRTGFGVEALRDALVDHERHRRVERVIQRLSEGTDALRTVADDEALAETVRRLSTDLEVYTAAVPDEPGPFVVDDLLDQIRSQPEGLSTGLQTLDDLDIRFGPGELAIIGARTQHAKTTALVAIISNWMEL